MARTFAQLTADERTRIEGLVTQVLKRANSGVSSAADREKLRDALTAAFDAASPDERTDDAVLLRRADLKRFGQLPGPS
jgi:hypothetical protein